MAGMTLYSVVELNSSLPGVNIINERNASQHSRRNGW